MNSDPAAALLALDRVLDQSDYAGPDPYDGLLSPLAQRVPGALGRQVLAQCVKRSPVELRHVLRVPPVRMAKTLGLVCGSLSSAPWLPRSAARRTALVGDLIRGQNGDGGWGYEFDVQMRWGSYDAGTSNIIATTFVVDGALGELTTPSTASVAELIEKDLAGDGYIRYAASSDRLIHNANVLGAMTLHRLAPGHPLIELSVERTLTDQRADGTWPYGDTRGTRWVDSFHTAYILWGLAVLVDSGAVPEARPALDRGTKVWLDRAFTGPRPRYFLDRHAGNDDIHNVATAISLLARLAPRDGDAAALLPAVLEFAARFRLPDGSYTTRRRGLPYIRWELAHMHRALAQVCEHRGVTGS